MDYSHQRPVTERRLHHEMRQKTNLRDTFFGLKSEPTQRPSSVATEFMDTDWDEEIISEAEDNSPRVSVNSSGQPSFTTISSYDEIPTPRSSQSQTAYLDGVTAKSVEGPKGPHLFRASTANSFEHEGILSLSLSPITPKVSRPYVDVLSTSAPRESLVPRRRSSPYQFTHESLITSELVSWSPEMVAQSMLDAGIEHSVAERFVENDINGAILITLKFEDLKELDIQSFGVRTKIWNQIQVLRDSRPSSPRAPTPIEDRPSREVKKEQRKEAEGGLQRRKSSRRRHKKPSREDIISPMESVSIVGIEQVIPKPHVCSKGENCSKFRKQQRVIAAFKKEHPFVDLDAGAVLIAGDPGNPQTARALDPSEILRPVSDAVPSVVASSDVLGPGNMTPFQYLQEATLRSVQSRDPQDNVRRFLDLQGATKGNEVPPTPPFEVFPQSQAPIEGLRTLPKLSIPGKQAPPRPSIPRSATVPPSSQPVQPVQSHHQEQPFIPYLMDRADPLSPDLQTPTNPYRFGTPFSEMDVPVTAIPIDAIARNVSQSVPPDMNYHTVSTNPPPRVQSRASARRPSFPLLPALNENMATPIVRTAPKAHSPRSSVRPNQQPLQAPPRVNYPWSPVERKTFEQAIPPSIPVKEAAEMSFQNGVSYQGPMKKRKTRLLRHEWQDGYFTLKGSRLAMHKDAVHIDRTLEYIDIDDYAIACSSLASQSKLTAAFKAMQITHNREKSDPVGAFAFQLIPQDKNAAKLRKRDSALSGGAIPPEGINGTGKTHHFAVKSRDERIDWMRELMLAKALRQKGEGFEVSVNGNMI